MPRMGPVNVNNILLWQMDFVRILAFSEASVWTVVDIRKINDVDDMRAL